jgi:Tol biopolymer transport system component
MAYAHRILPLFFLWNILVVPGGYGQAITSIKRASLSPGSNEQGASYSYDPEMDGSGRYIVFTSTADNFAAEGKVTGASHEHVYLRDTLTGTTSQLDVTSEGKTGSPGAAFNTGVRTFGSSLDPHISRDGKYVVFVSSASNISPDGANEQYGSWAYIKNIETGAIQRIPFATAGDPTKGETPAYLAINSDGSVVVIMSIIGNITDTTCASCTWELTVYNRSTNITSLINTGVTGNKFNPGISDDGRFVVFENQVGDYSAPRYVYLYDLTLSQLTSLNDGKEGLSPAISGDATFISYTDSSTVPVRVKLRERETGTETLVSGGIGGAAPTGMSDFSSLSADGRYVAFISSADNLVVDDGNGTDDIFVYDRVTGSTTLVSVQGVCNGVVSQEDFNTGPPTISSDGTSIVFTVLERLIAADKKNNSGEIVELADSNSFDDVYYATIDYTAQPDVFRKGFTPATPLVSVNCSGAEARVQLENILTRAGTSSIGLKASKIKKLKREVIFKRISGQDSRGTIVRRRNAKRNLLTTTGLPAGTYSVQLKAQAKLSNGKTVESKLSKPANFTISN